MNQEDLIETPGSKERGRNDSPWHVLGPTEDLEEAWGGQGVQTRVRVLDHGVRAALRTSSRSQFRRRRELGEGNAMDFYVSKGAILSACRGLKVETAGSKDSERGRNVRP